MRIKQSVCLPMMKPADYPVEEFLPAVKRMGFEAVEIWQRDDNFEKLMTLCRRHGLALASMIGHNSLKAGLNSEAEHLRIEAELKTSIDLAAEHGIPGLICFSGSRHPNVPERQAIATTVLGFRKIAPYAEKKGVNLCMEVLNSKVDHSGYDCDRTAWGVAVCSEVASPRVKLLYDIYHMQIMEGDVIRTITQNIRWIGHFHTGGVPGRHDLDETQELNYGAVCQAIASTDYPLYVGHEFKPKGEVLATLTRTFKICDKGAA